MERETLQLDKYTLSVIMNWNQGYDAPARNKYDAIDYQLIENIINSTDPEDGGYEADAIIKRKSDNKYFKISYQEWDYHWEYGDFDNFEPELVEVFPKEENKIIYE